MVYLEYKLDTFRRYKAIDACNQIEGLIEKGLYLECEQEDDIFRWIKVDRWLTDLHQLYQVYLWNYQQLMNGVTVDMQGEVSAVFDNQTTSSKLIQVNGYSMNCISSGVNLITFVESFLKHEGKTYGFEGIGTFKAKTQEEYDSNFNYAFGYLLRNYSQHGNLIVSMYPGENGADRICFDPFQLSNPSGVGVKAEMRKKLEKLLSTLSAVPEDVIRLSFRGLIHSFHKSVCSLYSAFFSIVQEYFSQINTKAISHLSATKSIIQQDKNGASFFVVLLNVDEMLETHVIMGEPQGLMECFRKYQNEVQMELDQAEINLEIFKKSFKPTGISIEH